MTRDPDFHPDRSALFQSMALHGGAGVGGYFKVNGNLKNLIDAFKQILTTITAKNSVFASSSLPVSVNTQGTYLNQVYMGMFRPDVNDYPRWFGNLKQYQFAMNTTTNTLFLADSLGNAAISSSGTGEGASGGQAAEIIGWLITLQGHHYHNNHVTSGDNIGP